MDIIKKFEENPNISEQDVKKIYHKLVRRYHPDFNPDNIEKSNSITQKLNNQYAEILKRIKLRTVKQMNNKENSQNDLQNKKDSKKHKETKYYRNKTKFNYRRTQNSYDEFEQKTDESVKTSDFRENLKNFSKNYIILEKSPDEQILINKDYGIKKILENKVNRYEVIYMNSNPKEQITQIHEIYGVMDFYELEKNDEYKKYIVNNLLTKEKLKSVSESLYGYIGNTIKKENGYQQQCDIKIFETLKNKSKEQIHYFQRNDSSIFSLQKLYSEIKNNETLDIYAYTNNINASEKQEQRILKTKINMDRLVVNKKYRDQVFNKYLNSEWIDKCIKENEGNIGNPEAEYKNQVLHYR